MSKFEKSSKHVWFTMFFESRGMQQRRKIYQIPNLKPSKKHSHFQERFLLDFEVIWKQLLAPFRHPRARFAEKTHQDGRVIFVGYPWGRQNVLLA